MNSTQKLRSLRVDSKVKVLKDILDREVLLILYQRGIPNFTNCWLETLRLPKAKDLFLSLDEDHLLDISESVERYIRKAGKSSSIDIVNWITSDITDQVSLFFKVTGAQQIVLKLRQNGVIENQSEYAGWSSPEKVDTFLRRLG